MDNSMKLFDAFEAVKFPEENWIFITNDSFLKYIYDEKYKKYVSISKKTNYLQIIKGNKYHEIW